jgi:plastocyanin
MSRQDEVRRVVGGRPGRSVVRRWLLAVGTVLAGGALLGSAPAGAGNTAGDITMFDNRYAPAVSVVAQGQSVEFTNFGQVVHDARDGTGLGLFTTGYIASPNTETIGPLPGAGGYRYYCTFHPEMAGRIRVPVTASRTQSPAGSPVTVRWATSRAPTGLVFDVQRRRPGTEGFVEWRTGVTAASARFWPAVRGPWMIRARVRQQAGAGISDWSPARAIRVT